MPDLCVGIDKANIGKGYDEWEAGVTEEKVILWSETCALVQNYHTPQTWTRCYLDQNNHVSIHQIVSVSTNTPSCKPQHERRL